MKVAEIKDIAERHPFRPFSIRLNNGAMYRFGQPPDFGVPQEYHLIVYFGRADVVLIGPGSVVEVMPQ